MAPVTSSINRCTMAAWATSAAKAVATPPEDRIYSTVAEALSPAMSTTATCRPARAMPIAMALPIPLPPEPAGLEELEQGRGGGRGKIEGDSDIAASR